MDVRSAPSSASLSASCASKYERAALKTNATARALNALPKSYSHMSDMLLKTLMIVRPEKMDSVMDSPTNTEWILAERELLSSSSSPQQDSFCGNREHAMARMHRKKAARHETSNSCADSFPSGMHVMETHCSEGSALSFVPSTLSPCRPFPGLDGADSGRSQCDDHLA